MKLKLKKNTKQ